MEEEYKKAVKKFNEFVEERLPTIYDVIEEKVKERIYNFYETEIKKRLIDVDSEKLGENIKLYLRQEFALKTINGLFNKEVENRIEEIVEEIVERKIYETNHIDD